VDKNPSVGLVDDDDIYYAGLAFVLAEGGYDSCRYGSLSDAGKAQADVIIFDYPVGAWPDEELAYARRMRPRVGLIALTANLSGEDVRRFLRADPLGKAMLLKGEAKADDVLQAIKTVGRKGVNMGSLALTLLTDDPRRGGKGFEEITRREFEVLHLVSRGFTNDAIGATLFVQPRTVEHHINSIFHKLNLSTPAQGQHARVAAVLKYLEYTAEYRKATTRRADKAHVA
jgi:DNA-binding NarL/FixJ family response regulator